MIALNFSLRANRRSKSVVNSANPGNPGKTTGPLLTYPIRTYHDDRHNIWKPAMTVWSAVISNRKGVQPSKALTRAHIAVCWYCPRGVSCKNLSQQGSTSPRDNQAMTGQP